MVAARFGHLEALYGERGVMKGERTREGSKEMKGTGNMRSPKARTRQRRKEYKEDDNKTTGGRRKKYKKEATPNRVEEMEEGGGEGWRMEEGEEKEVVKIEVREKAT